MPFYIQLFISFCNNMNNYGLGVFLSTNENIFWEISTIIMNVIDTVGFVFDYDFLY